MRFSAYLLHSGKRLLKFSGGMGSPTEEIASHARRWYRCNGLHYDAIVEGHHNEALSVAEIVDRLHPLRSVCRWTHGTWDFGHGKQRAWNELQNTGSDIILLADFLLTQYRERVWKTRLQLAV
jgi:hypothetical protein